jgi:hypothetical protein
MDFMKSCINHMYQMMVMFNLFKKYAMKNVYCIYSPYILKAMLKYLFFLSTLFLCCTDFHYNERASVQHQKDFDTTTLEHTSLDYMLADSFRVAKLREYTAQWNKSCFPIPVGKFLLRAYAGDRGYDYISANFDSLTEKISTEKERSAGSPCAWKQSFKSGITYEISSCQASGAAIEIHTQCPDKTALMKLVDILFYQPVNNWNADSTIYSPILDGPGAYYYIEKNEQGNYNLKYTYDN